MSYFEITYGPNWKGIDASQSSWDLDNNSLAVGSSDFLIKHNGLVNGLNISNWSSFYTTPDNGQPILVTSNWAPTTDYNSVQKGIYLSTTGHVWTTTIGSGTLTDRGATPLAVPTDRPLYTVNIQGTLYVPVSGGIIAIINSVAPTTLTSFAGGIYISELGGHILMANTVEGGTPTGQRLRWSGVYNFAQWDTTVDDTAGFQDLSDVSDFITGLFTFGTVGYILRTNGITQINVTSNGTAPFQFDHLWNSNLGIGCYYPFSSSQYGNLGIFVGREDIYMLSLGGVQSIGGVSKDNILTDLYANNAQFFSGSQVIGSIVPYFTGNDGVTRINGSYLSYILAIPTNFSGNNGSVIWIYDINKGVWSRVTAPNLVFTSFPSVFLASNGVAGAPYNNASRTTGGPFTQGLVVAGAHTVAANNVFYLSEGNGSSAGSTNTTILRFKVEQPKVGRKFTLHKVIVNGVLPAGTSSQTINVKYYASDGTTKGPITITLKPVASGVLQGLFSNPADLVWSDSFIQVELSYQSTSIIQVTKVTIFGAYGDGDQL